MTIDRYDLVPTETAISDIVNLARAPGTPPVVANVPAGTVAWKGRPDANAYRPTDLYFDLQWVSLVPTSPDETVTVYDDQADTLLVGVRAHYRATVQITAHSNCDDAGLAETAMQALEDVRRTFAGQTGRDRLRTALVGFVGAGQVLRVWEKKTANRIDSQAVLELVMHVSLTAYDRHYDGAYIAALHDLTGTLTGPDGTTQATIEMDIDSQIDLYTPVPGYTLRLRADSEINPPGGPVQTWGNTGTTADMTQATAGSRPSLSADGVEFDGVADFVAGPTFGDVIDADGFTIFVAFTPLAWSTTAALGSAHLNHGILSVDSWFGLSMRNVPGAELMLWSVEIPSYKGVTLPATLGARHVVCYRFSGSVIYASVNGGAEVSAACGPVNAIALDLALRVGRGFSIYSNVRVFEVLAYDSNLSPAEVLSNINGLKSDWSIP